MTMEKQMQVLSKQCAQRVPTLRFPEFSGEWDEKQINEITSYVDYRGKTPKKSDSGIFLITAKNIRQGYIDYECSKEYIPMETYDEVMRRGKPLIGDVLITTEAPCGNIASIDKEGVALAQRVIKFRGKENIHNYFLKFYFLSNFFQKKLSEKATGGIVRGIKGSHLHKMTVKLPTFLEQQKIAEFLSSADAWIENLCAQKTSLESYKKAMMQKLFSQEIRFKDDNGKTFPVWDEKRLGDVSEFFSGGTPMSTKKEYYSGIIPFIKSGEISKNRTAQFISEEALNQSSSKKVNKGDLLYALYGATSGSVAISRIDGAINQAVLCIRTSQNKNWLYQFLSYSKSRILAKYLQGGQGNLSADIIKKMKINFPSLPEQQKIANFLTAIDKKIASKQKQITQAKKWKHGLMQELFV